MSASSIYKVILGYLLDHKVIPALRPFVRKRIEPLYSELCNSDKFLVDSSKNQLTHDPRNRPEHQDKPVSKDYQSQLMYKHITGASKKNSPIPIENVHKFARLFLQKDILDSFNLDSADATALLGLIVNVSCFKKEESE